VPHHATRHDHLDRVEALQDVHHIDVVGDDHQPAAPAQCGRDLLGGGADIDQQR
jgi:hypothetical protein